MTILVATRDRVLRLSRAAGALETVSGVDHRPTSLAAAPEGRRAWCGTEDGVYRSEDGGVTWRDPETVVVSAASGAKSAYAAGLSDGRLYRRTGGGPWQRVTAGWPETPETIAPLLSAGREPGELWAADERGLHRSADGGESWTQSAAFETTPAWLRGLALLRG